VSDSESFSLHPRLLGESVFVRDLQLSRLVLMNNKRFPWLLLVPRLPDISEIVDLSDEDQRVLWGEIARISKLLRDLFHPDKLNVATIGNLVPQLHVHLIARFQTDEAWPKPTFGFAPPLPYGSHELEELKTRILAELAKEDRLGAAGGSE
jgi:diadenosine tetraphosphate (Ap4A) HIT family hydrolase